MPKSTTLALADLPPGGVQLKIPLRFDARRGCDKVRRRIYADPRIRPAVAWVLTALSEFVNVNTRKAFPKRETLAAMTHSNVSQVSRLMGEAEGLGVLMRDRNRRGAGCCYTFAESWLQWFRDDSETCVIRTSRSAPDARLEVHETHVSTGTDLLNTDQHQADDCDVGDTGADDDLQATEKQRRMLRHLFDELGEDAPDVSGRLEASRVIRDAKRRVHARRAGPHRELFTARRRVEATHGRRGPGRVRT